MKMKLLVLFFFFGGGGGLALEHTHAWRTCTQATSNFQSDFFFFLTKTPLFPGLQPFCKLFLTKIMFLSPMTLVKLHPVNFTPPIIPLCLPRASFPSCLHLLLLNSRLGTTAAVPSNGAFFFLSNTQLCPYLTGCL